MNYLSAKNGKDNSLQVLRKLFPSSSIHCLVVEFAAMDSSNGTQNEKYSTQKDIHCIQENRCIELI